MSSSNTTKQFDGVDGDILGCSLDDYLSARTRKINPDELIKFFHIVMEDHTWEYEHHYLRLSNKFNKLILNTNTTFLEDLEVLLIKLSYTTQYTLIKEKDWWSYRGVGRFEITDYVDVICKDVEWEEIKELWKKYKYEFWLLIFGWIDIRWDNFDNIHPPSNKIWKSKYTQYNKGKGIRKYVRERLEDYVDHYIKRIVGKFNKSDLLYEKNHSHPLINEFRDYLKHIHKLQQNLITKYERDNEYIIDGYKVDKKTLIMNMSEFNIKGKESLTKIYIYPPKTNLTFGGDIKKIIFPKRLYFIKEIIKEGMDVIGGIYDSGIEEGILGYGSRNCYVDLGIKDESVIKLVELYCKGIKITSTLQGDDIGFQNLLKVRDSGGFKVGDDFIEIEDDQTIPAILWVWSVGVDVEKFFEIGIQLSYKYPGVVVDIQQFTHISNQLNNPTNLLKYGRFVEYDGWRFYHEKYKLDNIKKHIHSHLDEQIISGGIYTGGKLRKKTHNMLVKEYDELKGLFKLRKIKKIRSDDELEDILLKSHLPQQTPPLY